MSTFDVLWLAWPWIGFGGAIVIFILLFTDVLRSDKRKKRIFDPEWLSWFMVFAYLIHVLEEYGLHISNGQFELITSFKAMGIDERFGEIPLAFFPCVNILLTWIALPIAAKICKKNPTIGLSGMGFLFFNGLTHLAGTFAMKLNILENPGFITGVLVFIPLFIWICFVHKKQKILLNKWGFRYPTWVSC